jgi:rubrerythrin
MPDFTSAFNAKSFDKLLSRSEFVRALRFSIAAEYEAVQIYEQIMEAITDEHAKRVINDIINEERLHAGQFMDLLFAVAPEEKTFYDKGAQENQGFKKS